MDWTSLAIVGLLGMIFGALVAIGSTLGGIKANLDIIKERTR